MIPCVLCVCSPNMPPPAQYVMITDAQDPRQDYPYHGYGGYPQATPVVRWDSC